MTQVNGKYIVQIVQVVRRYKNQIQKIKNHVKYDRRRHKDNPMVFIYINWSSFGWVRRDDDFRYEKC